MPKQVRYVLCHSERSRIIRTANNSAELRNLLFSAASRSGKLFRFMTRQPRRGGLK